MRGSRSRHLLSAALALGLVATTTAPAAAKWKEQPPPVEQSVEAEPSPSSAEATTMPGVDVAPTIDEALVGDAGSLYEVATAIGLGAAGAPTGDGVGVALVDTGITDVAALRHSNVTVGPDFSFDGASPDLRGLDLHGHGTHLAGLIAASDEAWAAGDHRRLPGRQVGMAPDADLLSVKVGAHDGSVDVSQVIAAINWVVDNRAAHDIRVLALAYGTDGDQDPYLDPLSHAVERAWHAGIVVVVAAGNDGGGNKAFVNPAHNPFVVTAGAADLDGDGWITDGRVTAATFASGANGANEVEVVAPGRSIVGPRVVGGHADQVNGPGRVGDEWVRATGTSQAAAVIAGASAALLQARPELTPDEVKHVLQATGLDVAGDNSYSDAGFVQVDDAVERDLDARIRGRDKQAANASPRVQRYQPSTGTGSLDAARGTHRLELDGVALTGEVDVFGNDFSASQWHEDAWTGMAWNGMAWNADTWNGSQWHGMAWNADTWAGMAWNGSQWHGMAWNADTWAGMAWNGSQWHGIAWNGSQWHGMAWNGMAWNGTSWG